MTQAASDLNWVDWLSAVSSIIAILTLIWFLIGLLGRLRRASIRSAIQEFDVLARQPWHVAMFVLTLGSATILIIFPPTGFPQSLVIAIPTVAGALLLLSFFLAQNHRLMRNIVLNEIRKSIERANRKRNQPLSAIRFDVDLLVAINDYSFAVGTQILELARETVVSAIRRLRDEGIEATLVSLPEGDEMVVILPGVPVDEAADIADEVRRHVKASLSRIPYYREACESVVQSLRNPPLTAEEREGIGTLSAGVAAYGRGEEALLSDISTAVKECKFRGRNKTIIHNHGGASDIRSDYTGPSSS